MRSAIRQLLNQSLVREVVRRALEEDIGTGDLTSRALFADERRTARAVIVAKEEGILAGLPVAEFAFRELDARLAWKSKKSDGDPVRRGEIVVELRGRLEAILMAERVALNFLQRMSGIATLTRRFVERTRGYRTKILDTRKTAPGLRILDKYSVRAGGGSNHRFGLFDGVLLKDNHIRVASGVGEAVRRGRLHAPPGIQVEVEVTTLAEVNEALAAGADILLLDNMTAKTMKEAVRRVGHRAIVEASGGIRLENLREVAATGVDWISVGALTHSVRALDLSLEVVSA